MKLINIFIVIFKFQFYLKLNYFYGDILYTYYGMIYELFFLAFAVLSKRYLVY